jgi:hypothetical protein
VGGGREGGVGKGGDGDILLIIIKNRKRVSWPGGA